MERILPSPTPLSEPYWQGCRDGVLRISLARPEQDKPRRIEVR